ncbi:MAG: hypothetical protein OXC07_06310 [Kistimonas sp.]|nr:hypothetical protein [Kistimonas sp.]
MKPHLGQGHIKNVLQGVGWPTVKIARATIMASAPVATYGCIVFIQCPGRTLFRLQRYRQET